MPEYKDVGLFVQDMDQSDLVLTGKVTRHEPTAIQFKDGEMGGLRQGSTTNGYTMGIRFTVEPEQWFKGREEEPIQFVAQYCDSERYKSYPTAEEATAEIARLFKYSFAKPPSGQQWLFLLDRREFGLYGWWMRYVFGTTVQMYKVDQGRVRYFSEVTGTAGGLYRQQEDMSLGELEDLMTELGPR